MTISEHDPSSGNEEPFSRWEDIKQRISKEWRRNDFSRHTFYWSVIVLVGIFGYGLALRLAEALGIVG